MSEPTGDAVFAAVATKMKALQAILAAKVDANLSGDVLHLRSGALRQSIRSTLDRDGFSASASLASIGVAYAAIQEYGGRTGAHLIVPSKAEALRFERGGGIAFAKSVHHPGSTIPARSYLGSALEAMRVEITDGIKAAVVAALEPTV